MEAMACGCCVVATAVGGNPELVDDGATGLLFPSRDRNALIARIAEVVDDAEKLRALGAAAAEKMRREFSLARSVEKMQEIYQSVLSPE